jgi:hypothetical protein
MTFKKKKINDTEYEIRKTERGIRVLHAQGADPKRILEYGEKREKLQNELERLTEQKYFSSGQWKILVKGRREPKTPEWPL